MFNFIKLKYLISIFHFNNTIHYQFMFFLIYQNQMLIINNKLIINSVKYFSFLLCLILNLFLLKHKLIY